MEEPLPIYRVDAANAILAYFVIRDSLVVIHAESVALVAFTSSNHESQALQNKIETGNH